jgi:hypothetical protein
LTSLSPPTPVPVQTLAPSSGTFPDLASDFHLLCRRH